MTHLEHNLDTIMQKVEDARLAVSAHHIVKVVGVTKYTDTDTIRKLYGLGQRAFGESKVQQYTARAEELSDLPIEWHFIGRLQKNKINHLLAAKPALIHSVDSFKLAQNIDKRTEGTVNCLLQINSSGEESKAGVDPQKALETYERIKSECPSLNLKGVMTIGAHSEDEKKIAKSFEITRDIYEKSGGQICSMGMSADYELAIKCGSNMVRIGSAMYK